jgi:hypothetical protein
MRDGVGVMQEGLDVVISTVAELGQRREESYVSTGIERTCYRMSQTSSAAWQNLLQATLALRL